jgi:hypothetical protein
MNRKFEKDWNFYILHKDKFNFSGEEVVVKYTDFSETYSAKECFYYYDSTGVMYNCSEEDLLKQVINCKKSINFQIKQWVEGLVDLLEYTEVYMNEFQNPPKWIRKAFVNQSIKYWNAKNGLSLKDENDLNEMLKRERYYLYSDNMRVSETMNTDSKLSKKYVDFILKFVYRVMRKPKLTERTSKCQITKIINKLRKPQRRP